MSTKSKKRRGDTTAACQGLTIGQLLARTRGLRAMVARLMRVLVTAENAEQGGKRPLSDDAIARAALSIGRSLRRCAGLARRLEEDSDAALLADE